MHKKQNGSCWPLSRLTLYQENHTVYSATFLLQNFGYTKMEANTLLRINVDLTYRQHSQGSSSSTCATWYILVSFKMAYPIHVLKSQQPSVSRCVSWTPPIGAMIHQQRVNSFLLCLPAKSLNLVRMSMTDGDVDVFTIMVLVSVINPDWRESLFTASTWKDCSKPGVC